MPYIYFSDDQKLRASSVNLEEFLRHQGEKLIRSGPEFRLTSDHSITIRGSEWFDHATEQGGGPISFVQNFYGLSYPEAVTRLLGSEQGTVYAAAKQQEQPKKEFALPPANRDMRRVYAYLLKRHFLDRNNQCRPPAFTERGNRLLHREAQNAERYQTNSNERKSV